MSNHIKAIALSALLTFVCGQAQAQTKRELANAPFHTVMNVLTDLPHGEDFSVPQVMSPEEGVACFSLIVWRDGRVKKSVFVESQSTIADEDVIQMLQDETMHQRYAPFVGSEAMARAGCVYYVIGESPIVQKASFKGDSDKFQLWVNRHLKYPSTAMHQREQGVVQTCFNVLADGSIANVTVIDSASPSLDAEAVRVISSSPKWAPATIDGTPVPMSFIFPVQFFLMGED